MTVDGAGELELKRSTTRTTSKTSSRSPSISKLTEQTFPANYGFDEKENTAVTKTKGLFSFLVESDKQWLVYITILAFIVRFAFLNHPSVVIFDEVHFGGFAQKYLKREFFTDLHPPLARLLVTLSAWIGGFDAKFSFYNIGADYIKAGVPYVTMRAFTAFCGAAVAPIAFLTMRAMDTSIYTTLAVTSMIIFDNALMTQSRLILLDSYLVFFTTLVAFFWVLFQNQRDRPFSREWKLALLGLGASIALAASCKWVGLFAVVGIGLYTIVDLWNILGDVKVPLKSVGRHLVARAIALIALPITIYIATFWIHFALLRKFTPAAAGMSIEFQQTLDGGLLPPTMANVYFGSQIRIRQYRSEGAFLHSHSHNYPEGSKQQQVTGYHHRDKNNLWIVRRAFDVNKTYVEPFPGDEREELIPLKHLDELRLEHIDTGRFLHSHSVDPPVSNKEKQREVSCYGHDPSKFSDYNDNWRIEIVDDSGDSITEDPEEEGAIKPQILAIGTKFRFVHRLISCTLHCRNKPLPEWGFKQSEITCGYETLKSNQIWVIESNEHPLADSGMKISFKKKGFLGKFVELNKMMWQTNAGLPSHHPFGSRPDSWPLLTRGIGFWNGNHVPKTEKQYKKEKEKKGGDSEGSGEDDNENNNVPDESVEEDPEDKVEQGRLASEYVKFKGQQMYLLGNPVLWWSSTAAIGIYMLTLLSHRMLKRRGFSLAGSIEKSAFGSQLNFFSFSGFMFVQWLWHYIPFFGMKRQLFLHHYLPALYFSALLFAIMIESGLTIILQRLSLSTRVTDRQAKMVKMAVLLAFVSATVVAFWKLAPLGYGLRMSKTQCESLKWLKRWDFDCNSLVDPVSNAIVTSDSQ